MKLHERYLENMKNLLGDAYDAFLDSYNDNRIKGIRVNTLKISVEAFKRLAPFKLEPIPWTTDGFYIDEQERPGKHPYWHAGLYYIQEPSAMLPASLLEVSQQSRVLDLCASPGGKTLQLAAKLNQRGLLVTNDISSGRIKPLVRNIEQFGIMNAVVLNDSHDKLSKAFGEAFEGILVDAPCSGEGMFRKDDGLIRDWMPTSNTAFQKVQKDILEHAASMLKPSGCLVYSTCTFSPLENEQVVESLVHDQPEFYEFASRISLPGGIKTEGGKARIWPHLSRGEGHFAAIIYKKGEPKETVLQPKGMVQKSIGAAAKGDTLQIRGREAIVDKRAKHEGKRKYNDKNAPESKAKRTREVQTYRGYQQLPEAFKEFAELNFKANSRIMQLLERADFEYAMDRLNLLPELALPLENIRVVRKGLQLGELVHGRFKPSQALIMALEAEDFKRQIDFCPDDAQLMKYLKGDTLILDNELASGLYMITVSGYPLGLGKWDGKCLKNLYPPAWRMQ